MQRVLISLLLLCAAPQLTANVNCETGAPAHSQDQLFSNDETYFLREACFGRLPFETGPYRIVEPPDASMNRLFIQTHDGLPRFGAHTDYGGGDHRDPLKYQKEAISHRFATDSVIYANLLVAKLNAGQFTADALLAPDGSGLPENKRRRPDRLPTVPEAGGGAYSARLHLQSLAASTPTIAAANEFRCASMPDAPCYQGFQRGPGWNWGGGQATEFAARRAYTKYVQEEVPKLKSWADTLSTEAYVVDAVGLYDYDFDREGFPVRIANINNIVTSSQHPQLIAKVGFAYQPRQGSARLIEVTGEPTVSGVQLFMPYPMDRAESLMNEQKQIYAVMRVVLHGMYPRTQRPMEPPGRNLFHYGRPMAWDFAEPVIEYYKDSRLTEKLFEINLNGGN